MASDDEPQSKPMEEVEESEAEESVSSDGSELSEEDKELIQENVNKRRIVGPDEPASKKQAISLENLFDDEEEEPQVPQKGPHPSSKTEEEDDLRDFIVSEEEEGGKEEAEKIPTKKAPTVKKSAAPSASRTFSGKKISVDAWHDLLDIFGDGSEYQEMLDSFSKKIHVSAESEAAEEETPKEPQIEQENPQADSSFVVTEEEAMYILKELDLDRSLLSEVILVLDYILKDHLEIIYLENYQRDVSLDGDTLWAIFDAHLNWKTIISERENCLKHGIPGHGLMMFDTVPEYLGKFVLKSTLMHKRRSDPIAMNRESGAEDDFTSLFPDPAYLVEFLKRNTSFVNSPEDTGSSITEELKEYAAFKYALHPSSFQFFFESYVGLCKPNEAIISLLKHFEISSPLLREIVAKALNITGPIIQKKLVQLNKRKAILKRHKDLVKEFQRYLECTLQMNFKDEEEIVVVYASGDSCLCGIINVETGNLVRTFKFQEDAFKDYRYIVLGGCGPILKTVYLKLNKLRPFLVKPLTLSDDSLANNILSLGRLVIDPLLELCRLDNLATGVFNHKTCQLTKEYLIDPVLLEKQFRRILMSEVASRGIDLTVSFKSDWRKASLRILPRMTVELLDSLEGVRNREHLKDFMNDLDYKNLAGFFLIPKSKEPTDGSLVDPETKLPSKVSRGDLHTAVASSLQVAEMLLDQDMYRGKILSGVVIKDDYPYSLLVKLKDGIEGIIKKPFASIAPGKTVEASYYTINYDFLRIELVPERDDSSSSRRTGVSSSQDLPPAIISKALTHPLFREMSGTQVEDHFRNEGLVGDVVIHPARRVGQLSLSWKVSGAPLLVQHITLEVTRDKKWRVLGEVADDLDEIAARFIDPLAQIISSILSCPKYFAPSGYSSDDSDKSLGKLAGDYLRGKFSTGKIAYCLWLSKGEPGILAYLSSCPSQDQFRHEQIRLQLGGSMSFRGKKFDRLDALIDWWKHNYNPAPSREAPSYAYRR
jgi:hypothetical protein